MHFHSYLTHFNSYNITRAHHSPGTKDTNIGVDGRGQPCCGGATNIAIDASVTEISPYSFASCGASTVDLSEAANLVTVSRLAFYNMNLITEVDFSNTQITTIGSMAFNHADALAKVHFPSTVTQIDSYAFMYTKLNLKDQVEWNGVDCASVTAAAGEDADTIFPFACVDTVYTYTSATTCTYANNGNAPCCGAASVVKIDATVTNVAYGAFKDCDTVNRVDTTEATQLKTIESLAFTKMSNLVIADLSGAYGLVSLGAESFFDSKKLNTLKLSSSMTSIGSHSFSQTKLDTVDTVDFNGVDCASTIAGKTNVFEFTCPIEEADLEPVDTVYTYTSATTCTYTNNGNAPCCGTATVIKIDATVTHVAYGAFKDCDTVHSVDTTEATSLETIGSLAFTKMDSLTSADLSGATVLTHLGAESFYNCPQLAAVKLSSSIYQIGSHSFAGANLLDTVDTIDFNGVDCASMIVGKTNVFKFACPP